MKREAHDSILSPNCQSALQSIELDPVNLTVDVLKHISVCPMCSEARVLWLAQEDFNNPIAPAAYFERLPERILQKLPVPSTRHSLRVPLLLSAASLMLLTGLVGYWAGRQELQPVVLEAMVPPRDMQELLQDPMSFSSMELFSQVPDLTPEEINDIMSDLKKPEASLQPSKPGGD